MVEIYATRILADEEFQRVREELLTLIPEPARKKITAFYRMADVQRSLFGELLLRRVLCEKLKIRNMDLRIDFEEKGKPFIQNYPLHFNLSHSGVWVVVAFSGQPVGIDVEQIKKNRLEVARRFFTEEEFQNLMNTPGPERSAYFYTLWTLKESYLKAIGRGLTLSLNSFNIKTVQEEYFIDINGTFANTHLRIIPLESGYKLAVCAFEPAIRQNIILLPAGEYLSSMRSI